MKKKLLLLCTALTIGMLSCDQNELTEPVNDTKPSSSKVAAPGQWQTVWAENFNDNHALRTADWNIVGGGLPGDGELRSDYNSSYTTYDKNHVQVAGGNLNINAVQYNNGGSYQSAFITLKQGFIPANNTEISIKASIRLSANKHSGQSVDISKLNGFWPAFWMTNGQGWVDESLPGNAGKGRGWPMKGEYDIMELFTHNTGNDTQDRMQSNCIWGTSQGNAITFQKSKDYTSKLDIDDAKFHTYELRWSNKNGVHSMTTYLDNNYQAFVASFNDGSYTGLKIEKFAAQHIIFNVNIFADPVKDENGNIVKIFHGNPNIEVAHMSINDITVAKRTL